MSEQAVIQRRNLRKTDWAKLNKLLGINAGAYVRDSFDDISIGNSELHETNAVKRLLSGTGAADMTFEGPETVWN